MDRETLLGLRTAALLDRVRPCVRAILSEADEPLSTRQVIAAVCRTWRVAPDKKIEAAIGETLKKLSKEGEGVFTTHDGETFRAHGQVMRRWRWHPIDGYEPPAPRRRIVEEPVEDTTIHDADEYLAGLERLHARFKPREAEMNATQLASLRKLEAQIAALKREPTLDDLMH